MMYNETRANTVSRLEIEVLPLVSYTGVGADRFTRTCSRPTPPASFDLTLSPMNKNAEFATRYDVLLPDYLRSAGIGSYVFSKLISWGQQLEPSYVFKPLSLSAVDAEDDVAKERRNGFYRAHNFQLDFTHDPSERTGRCLSKPLVTLNSRPVNPSKILSVQTADAVLRAWAAENIELARKYAAELATTKNLRTELKAERKRKRNWAWLAFLLLVAIGLYGTWCF